MLLLTEAETEQVSYFMYHKSYWTPALVHGNWLSVSLFGMPVNDNFVNCTYQREWKNL